MTRNNDIILDELICSAGRKLDNVTKTCKNLKIFFSLKGGDCYQREDCFWKFNWLIVMDGLWWDCYENQLIDWVTLLNPTVVPINLLLHVSLYYVIVCYLYGIITLKYWLLVQIVISQNLKKNRTKRNSSKKETRGRKHGQKQGQTNARIFYNTRNKKNQESTPDWQVNYKPTTLKQDIKNLNTTGHH